MNAHHGRLRNAVLEQPKASEKSECFIVREHHLGPGSRCLLTKKRETLFCRFSANQTSVCDEEPLQSQLQFTSAFVVRSEDSADRILDLVALV